MAYENLISSGWGNTCVGPRGTEETGQVVSKNESVLCPQYWGIGHWVWPWRGCSVPGRQGLARCAEDRRVASTSAIASFGSSWPFICTFFRKCRLGLSYHSLEHPGLFSKITSLGYPDMNGLCKYLVSAGSAYPTALSPLLQMHTLTHTHSNFFFPVIKD